MADTMATTQKSHDASFQTLPRRHSFVRAVVTGQDPHLSSRSGGTVNRSDVGEGGFDQPEYIRVPRPIARNEEPNQLDLLAPNNPSRVKAVVSAINEEYLSVSCHLPNDNVDIDVPVGLVPISCAHFGAPVWVSVDVVGSIRQILVSERQPEDVTPVEAPNDLAEIDAWLSEGE